MPIFRWGTNFDPLVGFRVLQRELDRLLEWPRNIGEVQRVGGGNYPPVNIYNGDAELVVHAELAGVVPADLDISITGETLVIRGTKKSSADEAAVQFQRRERGSGEFSRTIILPDRVDADKVAAKMVNGVLFIMLPKSEAARPRQVSVQS